MEKTEIKGLNEYQQRALETAVYPKEFKTIYPALGMNGEAGEVADKVKKILRGDEGIIMKRMDTNEICVSDGKREEIALEVGDVLWYCATLAHDLGYTLQEIAEMNYVKLKSREERGKIGGSGDNR